jgi:putative copper export protein
LPGEWLADGVFTATQFIGPGICGVLMVLLFVPGVRGALGPIAWIAAIGIGGSTLITILPADFATETPTALISDTLTDVHPISGCIWVGGIATLVILAVSCRRLGFGAGEMWARIWKRFSIVAEICVDVTLATGLFLSWQLVSSVPQLWETTFGRILSVKLLLVLALIVIGGYNEFVLLPRISRLRREGDRQPLFQVVLRHFPRSVGVEVVLGIAVLCVVPFLNGSSRQDVGQSADPSPTGGIFAAVALVLVFGVIAFVTSARLHAAGEQADDAAAPAVEPTA